MIRSKELTSRLQEIAYSRGNCEVQQNASLLHKTSAHIFFGKFFSIQIIGTFMKFCKLFVSREQQGHAQMCQNP